MNSIQDDNDTKESIDDDKALSNHSTSSSADTSLHAIQILTKLLNDSLITQMMRVLQCKKFTERVLISLILKVFQRNIKTRIRQWNSEAKRKKRFLGGLSILNNQQKHRTEKLRKQQMKESGLAEVQQERGLIKLQRVVRRKVLEFKSAVFQIIIRNWFHYNKLFAFLDKRPRDLAKKCVGHWRGFLKDQKKKNTLMCKKLENVMNSTKRTAFGKVVDGDLILIRKNSLLACKRLERVVKIKAKLVFLQIARESRGEFENRFKVSSEILRKIENSRRKKGFCALRHYLYRTTQRKSFTAPQKLKILLIKRFSNIFASLFTTSLDIQPLKLLLFLHILASINNKSKQFALNKLKFVKARKFFLFPTKIMIKKIQILVKNTQNIVFSDLRTHKNTLRYIESSKKLTSFILQSQKYLKKSSFRAIKALVKRKKNQQILWKIKFYQLEGLIQHKNEENTLKLKFKHFFMWKKTSITLSKRSKKQIKRKVQKFVLKILTVLKKLTTAQRFATFLILKLRLLQEKSSLWALERLHSKHLKMKFFEKLKKKSFKGFLSPNSLKNSAFTFSSSHGMSSPRMSYQGKSTPTLPTPKISTSSRFAFYSTKKKSSGNISYRQSGILKTLYLNERVSLSNEFESLIRK